MADKINSYIGLAQRAGGVVFGEDIISEKLRKIGVVIIASDAPEKYIDRLKRKCESVECFEYSDLAQAIHRSNVKAIGITNIQLAKQIINLLRCVNDWKQKR